MYALSTLSRRTIPLIEPSSGEYLSVLACLKRLSRPFVNSTMACEHAYGSTTWCAWGGLQGLCQEYVLATLLLNISFAAVISVAYTSFNADKDIMDALVYLREKTGAKGSNRRRAVLETSLRSILYADDAGVFSQSPQSWWG